MSGNSICNALGNEERVALLRCLKKEQSVSELLEHCVFSQSALSQHLRILRDAGAVVAKREGRNVRYTAVPQAFQIATLLATFTKNKK